ncbi:MAG: UDP-3-O-acyl-N-acetylglucosamine deacetylase [Victivallales bacterium]|nr:UDP-3-O-acyl-N-acetylglucosamine deacetylase [Victivallales bacterium]
MPFPAAQSFRMLHGDRTALQPALDALARQDIDLRLEASPETKPPVCATTIAKPASVTGPATYSRGKRRTLRFLPSEMPGWRFRRIDLPDAPAIPAELASVCESSRAIVLQKGTAENRIRMSEHIVCHRLGLGVDNLLIETDSDDPPLFDSGSMEIVEAFRLAGVADVDSCPLTCRTVKAPVAYVNPERGSMLAWLPPSGGDQRLHLDVGIDFPTSIGRQRLQIDLTPGVFENGCHARTNCSVKEWRLAHWLGWLMPRYRNLGYTRENILIAGKQTYENAPRLCLDNGKSLEAVWHRTCMDFVAALSLLPPGRFAGTLFSYKAGHAMDVEFLSAILRNDLLTTTK